MGNVCLFDRTEEELKNVIITHNEPKVMIDRVRYIPRFLAFSFQHVEASITQ